MKRMISALAIASLFASPVLAASYNFDVLYSGGGVAHLAPGSDDPNVVNLLPGDSFHWTIRSDSATYWTVVTGGYFFPLMAFNTGPAAERVGDYDLRLLNDGGEVFSAAEAGASNMWVHVGTNSVFLGTGLKFDEMRLSYTLSATTPQDPLNPADTYLNGLLPIFGAPEYNAFSPGITYAVPEPETYAMMLAGLGVLGAAARRRRPART